MATIEKLFEFSDAQAMPDDATVISTNVLNWVENFQFEVCHKPLFIVVKINTVTSTGTSIVAQVRRHTTATTTSGTLLLTGEIVATANMSADPRSMNHILAVFVLPPRMDSSDYLGLEYTCVGTCSDGAVDAYVSPNVPWHSTQVNTSNI